MEIWPNSTFIVLIYELKIHAKIEFFIKNNKILKFFSFSKNKSCLTKSWDFLQKLTLFLKFTRQIGEGCKKCRGHRRRRTFFFIHFFSVSNPIPERRKELGLRRAKLGLRPRFARNNLRITWTVDQKNKCNVWKNKKIKFYFAFIKFLFYCIVKIKWLN